jgi:RNA-splicing ligase RtcB
MPPIKQDAAMKPHTIYSDAIEGKALAQFHDALKQPWAVRGALMPDAHVGYSLPIGAVVAAEGVVVPARVGFDIGCGMLAVKTSFAADVVRAHAKGIFDRIYRDVPTGFAHNKRADPWVAGEALPRSPALQSMLDRKGMVSRIEAAVQAEIRTGKVQWETAINRNHNHAEKKDGLWIHRKGATHAEDGMMGVIPGNMRDGSFIVRGKGNPEALCSSAHGAGRVMGRAQAKRTLDMAGFRKEMQDRGIQARVEDATLDEAASAYKDIFTVMAMQRDLVEVVHHIRPMINIKG